MSSIVQEISETKASLSDPQAIEAPDRLRRCLRAEAGRGGNALESLPFAPGDITAGCENEFQAVVEGRSDHVNLPRQMRESAYYRNLLRRVASGDVPARRLRELDSFLEENEDGVWENSWVTFQFQALSPYARSVLKRDLAADKRREGGPARSDVGRFLSGPDGAQVLRVPVSYLLKLALAQAIDSSASLPASIRQTGEKAMKHFLNDNTSPETYSFAPVKADASRGVGDALARETLRRFLLSQCLIAYANDVFGLSRTGQKAVLYAAPVTPVRQRTLNDLIPDQLYRDLFMSPCLSGWDEGEKKHQYMALCHQVLSRSRLHTLAKLREAGITTSNLVVMPSISNTSLANNGTHVSLGSRRLTELLRDGGEDFKVEDEKRIGDLVIKIVEHFLPLFVNTYTAAPFRMDFSEFHPENVLGFLPHELDFTHLRMLWRRWKKKADVRVFGQPITPTGVEPLDRALARILRLRGDVVPDFRLLDYLVSPMSTDESPSLDGRMGNDRRLRRDLAEGGIFDQRMAHYTLYRLREFGVMGFSGFEGRLYSVFPSLRIDMVAAVNMQAFVTALAYRWAMEGRISHKHIPDTPAVESERRQIIFGTAVGIPTFYVKSDGGNHLLRGILGFTRGCRASRRYPGFTRVQFRDYRMALLSFLRAEGEELMETMNMTATLDELEERVAAPERNGATAVMADAAIGAHGRRGAMRLPAADFNAGMERYYRTELRRKYLAESLDVFDRNLRALDTAAQYDIEIASTLASLTPERSACDVLRGLRESVLSGEAGANDWLLLIQLSLLVIGREHGQREQI